jgi:hypothetical protein
MVTLSNRVTIFEWCVVGCERKHKTKKMCIEKEIGLRAHNVSHSRLNSQHIGRGPKVYDRLMSIRILTLTINYISIGVL